MKTIVAIVLVLVTAIPVMAEWGLYANRDGNGFVMERTFAFQKDCDEAARAAWNAAKQKGAFGCAEYAATSFAKPGREPRLRPDGEFGESFRRAQKRERQEAIAERQRREEEQRRQESLQTERDRMRAIERMNEIEQQKLAALRRLR